MSDLLECLGQENLDRLSEAVGGTRLAVPRNWGKPPNGGRDSSDRLSNLLGSDLALLLVYHFAGSRIYVPRSRMAPPADRRKLKRLIKRDDLTDREIAVRVGCSIRTVEKRRAEGRRQRSTQGAQA